MKNLKAVSTVLLLTVILLTCSCAQTDYPPTIMWYDYKYSISINNPLETSMIDSELGIIKRYVYPMPKKSNDINFTNYFDIGDYLFSIHDIEITEAIAILKDGQYYKLGRTQSPIKLIWDNRVYLLYGSVDAEENKSENLDRQIGSVQRTRIKASEAVNGDITLSDFLLGEDNWNLFPAGSEIHHIKGFEANQAIAVIDKDGNIHYARYYKRLDR